ncbi:MAG: hypothetical protein ACPL28_10230 [bacterium]
MAKRKALQIPPVIAMSKIKDCTDSRENIGLIIQIMNSWKIIIPTGKKNPLKENFGLKMINSIYLF